MDALFAGALLRIHADGSATLLTQGDGAEVACAEADIRPSEDRMAFSLPQACLYPEDGEMPRAVHLPRALVPAGIGRAGEELHVVPALHQERIIITPIVGCKASPAMDRLQMLKFGAICIATSVVIALMLGTGLHELFCQPAGGDTISELRRTLYP